MKRILVASLVGIAAMAASSAQAYNDVGVSISLGQPGFYGRIDLGNAPPPRLVYAQPVWIERGPARLAPIYLHVPLDHQRDWRRHCNYYGACGQPVYFVRDDWYRDTYVPHYREHYYGGGWQRVRRDRDRDGIPDYRDPDRGQVRDRDRDGVPDYRDRDHGRGNDREHGQERGQERGHERGQGRGRDHRD